ncbi:MAG: type IV pilin protein [Gammaproteobacteria bacterium]|nr:type IV pilin protein [Gammaproteobacteria bacterium]
MEKQSAFTLIELMVTVAIIGILASIAYPSYQGSVMKSRRADAKGALLNQANRMERHFTETNSYIDATVPGNTDYYTLSIESASATAYTLRATPSGPQVNDSCGNLEIDQTGSKLPATSGCW